MSEFVDFLKEAFRDLGPVVARRMFGGHGLYHDGVMFALVADDTLYLKADEATVARFVDRGLPAFEYGRGEQVFRMSYHLAPAEVLEDPAEAARWGRLACEAAWRARRRRSR